MPSPSSAGVAFVRTLTLILLAVAYIYAAPGGEAADHPDVRPVAPANAGHAPPTYTVEAGLDGEIYPVFANYASLQRPKERHWATVTVTIRNSSDKPLRNRITVEIPGWSDQEIQIVETPAGAERTYQFAPSFLPRLYHNREIRAATSVVRVTGIRGEELFSTTAPVRLRSAQDMYWGPDFQYAEFIAAWVTPHDPRVEQVLRRAKEFMPARRMPGYESGRSEAAEKQSTIAQARAIYRALQEQGVSYVKSSLTLGGNQDWSERVRLPAESLRRNSANCIDGALLYASLFENLGMEPVVVLVPGHAYAGVRLTRGSGQFLYLETAYTGRASFEVAMATAARSLAHYRAEEVITVPIEKARRAGIYPMPE